MYECAILLIKKGKAYVCDLSQEEFKEYKGDWNTPGKNSPYRDRSVEENLKLFEEMKEGKYADGSKVLRAKIDMTSPNVNLRDPAIYRIMRARHYNTGDTWCIYPAYDFAHPIEDAIEHVTHSICTLEFEDHRPLYDWVLRECEFENPPRQIEFAKMYITHAVTGKRYIKKLVETGVVDGWDDPRLMTISALRRRGFTPEAFQRFIEMVGVSKATSSVDFAMLEACLRDDLKPKAPRMMAILDPIKLIIDNYPDDQVEYMDIAYNPDRPELGTRKVPFAKELEAPTTSAMVSPASASAAGVVSSVTASASGAASAAGVASSAASGAASSAAVSAGASAGPLDALVLPPHAPSIAVIRAVQTIIANLRFIFLTSL